MHFSTTVVPGMDMIFVTHFILEFTSDANSCKPFRFVQLTQEFHVIFVLLLAPPVLISVRSDDDIGLLFPIKMSDFITC